MKQPNFQNEDWYKELKEKFGDNMHEKDGTITICSKEVWEAERKKYNKRYNKLIKPL